MDNRPVGIFDSGLGGLTAVAAMKALLPDENIIYFGDSGRCPYGVRPRDQLRAMTYQNLEFISSFNCKAIIVACGTISANSTDILEAYPLPVFNVLTPSVQAMVNAPGEGPLAVIATDACIRSGSFTKAIVSASDGKEEPFSIPCQDFVRLCEAGHTKKEDPLLMQAVENYLRPYRDKNIRALLLGCTHFGIIAEAIGSYMGPETRLISASECAVEALKKYLYANEMTGCGAHCLYYTSGNPEEFDAMAGVILEEQYHAHSIYVKPIEV